MDKITTEKEFEELTDKYVGVALFFSTPACTVCRALKPRVETVMETRFPAIPIVEVDCRESPEFAAQRLVFTTPTILVCLEGKEALRFARRFSLEDFENELQSFYSMFFKE